MIKIHGLEKKLSPSFTLKIDDLVINDGERVALIGPNGSGKSTLLRLLAGILKPDAGSVEMSFPSDRLAYSPQSPYVFKGSAEYNIRLGADSAAAAEAIIKKCGLTGLKDKKALSLSGGEKQRVCLARMLAAKHTCLLLDEPLSAADIETGAALEELLCDYCRKNGTTLILSTHIPSEALRVSDKILIMNGGRTEEYTETAQLRSPRSDFGKNFISQWSV